MSNVRTSFRLQSVVHNASRLFDIVGNHTYTATETFAHYNKPVTITAP